MLVSIIPTPFFVLCALNFIWWLFFFFLLDYTYLFSGAFLIPFLFFLTSWRRTQSMCFLRAPPAITHIYIFDAWIRSTFAPGMHHLRNGGLLVSHILLKWKGGELERRGGRKNNASWPLTLLTAEFCNGSTRIRRNGASVLKQPIFFYR